eukprot:69270-Pyramimonas_sp.AAC.1
MRLPAGARVARRRLWALRGPRGPWAGGNSPWRGSGGPSRSFPRGPELSGNVFGPSGGSMALGRERTHRGGGLGCPAEAPRGGPSRQE